MLKVKMTTYWSLPKNNELAKVTTEIKQAIKKIEEEKSKKDPKKINDHTKLIQSIKKEYQKLVLRNELLKKNLKKTLDDKHLTTNLINHHRK